MLLIAHSVRRVGRSVRRRVADFQRKRTVFSGWPDGHRAAVSFSFDDARPSQIEFGVPVFDRLGVAVTFFVLPHEVAASVTGWLDAVARGHEMGNHTTKHPCSGNHVWTRGYTRERMTLSDFKWEVVEANRRLHQLLDVQPTVFAYPCGETSVGTGRRTRSLVPFISQTFAVGRTFNDFVSNWPVEFDPAQTACVNCDEQSLQSLMPRLEATVEDGAWLVLGGHEIGEAGGTETTDVDTIEAVVNWCRSNNVWIDTIGNVASAAMMRRSTPTRSRQ